MKKMFLPWGALALLMLLVPGAMAQMSPVRLTVTKIQKAETQRFEELGVYWGIYGSGQYTASGSILQVGDFVHYHINLALMSPKPMPALRIEWAVLVQPTGEENPRVIQGENMGKLDLGSRSDKFECDTQTVHVRTKAQISRRNAALARSSSPQEPSTGGSSADKGIVTEVLGYYVEVFDGDQVVASATQPADTKRKIEQLKNDQKGGQQRHRF